MCAFTIKPCDVNGHLNKALTVSYKLNNNIKYIKFSSLLFIEFIIVVLYFDPNSLCIPIYF